MRYGVLLSFSCLLVDTLRYDGLNPCALLKYVFIEPIQHNMRALAKSYEYTTLV